VAVDLFFSISKTVAPGRGFDEAAITFPEIFPLCDISR
jgi:hypothetical protein